LYKHVIGNGVSMATKVTCQTMHIKRIEVQSTKQCGNPPVANN
jgi:hypothetical protein